MLLQLIFRVYDIYNKVIDIIKFEKHFLNSTTDTQSKLLNTTLG